MSNKTLNINITKLALYGKVLGDETRLRILLELIDGEKNVKDLASFLGISDSAISHHLRELRLAKIVKLAETENKFIILIKITVFENKLSISRQV